MEDKGVTRKTADKIGEYVKLSGGSGLVDKLKSDAELMAVEDATAGVADMELLLQYCQLLGVLGKVALPD